MLLTKEDPEIDQLEETTLESRPQAAEPRRGARFVPPVPQSLTDTGLPTSIIEQLILKILYFKGDVMGGDLCRAMGLSFSLIEDMIDAFKFKQLIQVKSSLGYGPISAVLALTEQGRHIARDYLDNNQYVGPAPVSVTQYCESVQAQRMPAVWLTRERLEQAYSGMVTTDAMLDQIGPAISSGKSLLVYGQPETAKHRSQKLCPRSKLPIFTFLTPLNVRGTSSSSMTRCITAVQTEKALDSVFQHDGRWARCRRPFIASGGRLSLSMLDLSYNAVSKIYDAPFQMKANNGIYLVDDFGRQKATSAEILNRWIVRWSAESTISRFQTAAK